MNEEDYILGFPCQMPVKAMGEHADDFHVLIVEIARKHDPDLDETLIRVQESDSGKYLSVTLTVNAKSRAQMDGLYMELTAHERVVMAL